MRQAKTVTPEQMELSRVRRERPVADGVKS